MKRPSRCLAAACLIVLSVGICLGQDKSTSDSEKQSGKTAKKKVEKPVPTRVIKPRRAPELKLVVPVTWKEARSVSRMRTLTLQIPPIKGDRDKSELTIFKFGPQEVQSNIDRWVGQFQSKGRKAKITQGKTKAKVDYYLANISGTYKKPDGPPIMRKTKDVPGYRMLAVLINVKGKGSYVYKLAGPDKTVAAQLKAFTTMIGGDSKTEKPYKSPKEKAAERP